MKTIELCLIRKQNFEKKCIGEILEDNIKICDTLEPNSRKLTDEMTENYILANKFVNKTAIPTGKYYLKIEHSILFNKKKIYLQDVKGFKFIMIHEGNNETHTKGCILVGVKTIKNMLLHSVTTYEKLHDKVSDYMTKGHEVILNITELF